MKIIGIILLIIILFMMMIGCLGLGFFIGTITNQDCQLTNHVACLDGCDFMLYFYEGNETMQRELYNMCSYRCSNNYLTNNAGGNYGID